MRSHRRDWLRTVVSGFLGSSAVKSCWAATLEQSQPPLVITGLKVTPVALPDPPILAASGCHGPYFLRNVVELTTEGGTLGIGETHGGDDVTAALERARKVVVGQNAFAYQKFAGKLQALGMACYAGIELAALDACGRATGRRLCEMVGGPVRDSVEFAAYLFYRYAADHPVVLADPHLVDRAAAATVPSTTGARCAPRRRWPSWPLASATASDFGCSSSRAECLPRRSSATP